MSLNEKYPIPETTPNNLQDAWRAIKIASDFIPEFKQILTLDESSADHTGKLCLEKANDFAYRLGFRIKETGSGSQFVRYNQYNGNMIVDHSYIVSNPSDQVFGGLKPVITNG